MINFSEYFKYDESSPTMLINVVSRSSKAVAGQAVGFSLNRDGYLRVGLNYKRYLLHRIIWELHNGPIPDGMEIDHIDGEKTNNRLSNLRLATHQQNLHNTKKRKDGESILPKGIGRHSQVSDYFVAEIMHNGERHRRSSKNINELSAWLVEKRAQLHGKFARHT
ncbi:HNH endonuclease [Klebsiella michiganensis]